ncbi:MAG: hypothetical protein V8S97_00015 [Oscillospiraceae bacterium]
MMPTCCSAGPTRHSQGPDGRGDITTLRTGISAAHSARLFTRPDFETVGLVAWGTS